MIRLLLTVSLLCGPLPRASAAPRTVNKQAGKAGSSGTRARAGKAKGSASNARAVAKRATESQSSAKKARARASATESRTRARKTRARARRARTRRLRRHRTRRCRDIFCTAQEIRLDRRGEARGLNDEQVEAVADRTRGRLEPCLVQARRRDPDAVSARVEVVVDRRGRILASRVNGKRRGALARCVHGKLRGVRFPGTQVHRQVAAFTLAISR